MLPQLARRELIHRDAGANVRSFGFLGMHAGQERRRGPDVIAVPSPVAGNAGLFASPVTIIRRL